MPSIPAQIQLRHWQLRDLLRPTSTGLVFAEGPKLAACDLDGSNRRVLATLPTAPHCLAFDPATQLGLCGGANGSIGQVVAINPQNHTVEAFAVGDELINAVEFGPGGSALACSNDGGVYAARLDHTPELCTRVDAGMPVNSIALDGHGHRWALAGDKSVVQIWDHMRLEQTVRAPLGADVGSCVAFDEAGLLLAAAFQGGVGLVWDLRSMAKPLATVHSLAHARQRSPGALRVGRFAPVGFDKLVFSEDHGCVHSLDLGTLEHLVLPLGDSEWQSPRTVKVLPHELPETLGITVVGDQLAVATPQGILIQGLPERRKLYDFR